MLFSVEGEKLENLEKNPQNKAKINKVSPHGEGGGLFIDGALMDNVRSTELRGALY